MIPRAEIIDIIQKLTQRSHQDEVRWHSHHHYEGPYYCVAFANADLRVSRVSRHDDPDYISVSIVTSSGDEVGTLVVDEGEEYWETVSEFYQEGARCATGWDNVLKTIKKSIKKSGTIGEERKPRLDDDSVPF